MNLMDSKWADWSKVTGAQQHGDRFPLMRLVHFERGATVNQDQWETKNGQQEAGLLLNFSRGGLCLLTELAPEVQEVLRVQLPRSVPVSSSHTYVQVRWVRPLPFGGDTVYAVGLQFML